MSTKHFMEIYKELNEQLDEQLLQISKQTECRIKQAKYSISECILTLEKLKIQVTQSSFKTKEEEINFFKHLKPQISGKLIFYIQQFNIETYKPTGTEKQLKKYFSTHLQSINLFMDNNRAFYQYYRSESVIMDEKYFIRSKKDLHLILDQNAYNYDITFNTSHDNKVAQIIANDHLRDYLQTQINIIGQNLFSETAPVQIQPERKLKWTDNKIALIELMYAIHSAKCINSGKADLSEIAAVLEEVFDIDLKDYYRKYIEIKSRKGQYTKFLDQLKQALENRINIELQ